VLLLGLDKTQLTAKKEEMKLKLDDVLYILRLTQNLDHGVSLNDSGTTDISLQLSESCQDPRLTQETIDDPQASSPINQSELRTQMGMNVTKNKN